jgi:ABC-2 type transport system permease protein
MPVMAKISRSLVTQPSWWTRLYVMSIKELLQLGRDFVLLFFIVYAFTVDIYNAGSGVTLQVNHAALAVRDSDRSAASRELIGRFRPPYFLLNRFVQDPREGQQCLDGGDAMLVLDVPPQFQQSLAQGRPTGVQLQVDATNSVLGSLAASYATRVVGDYALDAGLARAGLSSNSAKHLPLIVDDHRVLFNPNQEDSWFMSISELLTIITVFAILLPAAAMVREKERGTIEQLLVSPLSPFQIMFSKVIAMTVVILASTALSIFVILKPIFHVPMRGSLLLFFAVTALYIFTTAGLGLFAATVSRNLAQAGMLTILILAPMLFLSGAWTPPEAMPHWLRNGMSVSPLHYYIDASFGILLKGAGGDLLWQPITAMLLIGGVIFGYGMWRFRKQFD